MLEDNHSQIQAVIVDDDTDIANVFAEYLEIQDIKVLAIGSNGKDAFELYQTLVPDVLFLDVMMPDFDGFYGLERIKQLNPDARIIMVTADPRRSTEERLWALGADAIIQKPFEIQSVLLALQRTLEV